MGAKLPSKGRRVPETVAEQSTPSTYNPLLQQIGIDDQELAEDDVPPPAYGEYYGAIHDEKNGTGTSAQLTDDGRVTIRINHFNRHLSQIIGPTLQQHVQDVEDSRPLPSPYIPPSLGGDSSIRPPPPLNIVVQVVGSRGDVQPFVALGKVLKDVYGHRVRLATHPTFKDFVQQQGLEFFSIGGDPTRLMAFMVKNPGLRPGFRSLMSGDVGQQRKQVAEYIQGCWRSCYRADDGTDDEPSELSASDPEGRPTAKHFVADCIIANPPSFAHIHCAERLGIPLHIMFTMPYSPTQAFPHPLANIRASNADPQLTNYISYALIEILSWQALGDIVNRFRVKCLDLDPVSTIWAPGMLRRLRIPHTYCWSPALIPKPKDWGSHISLAGFYFLNTASTYTPAPDLQAFLNGGPPPIYVGFGSIVLDDPNAMTELIFAAVRKTGQRVLLSKGWGGMGTDELRIPDGVFMLGNVPHDWLFKHVSCVVHHGGAGTTAAGIAAGRPTVVVRFFGDQPFWGAMMARAGAGPDPIPHKQLTADKLVEAINFCLTPGCLERAEGLASKIATERGCDTGAQSFHQFLDPDRLRCSLASSRPAAWRVRRTDIKLSAFAAYTLVDANLLDLGDLKLFRAQEYQVDEGPWDPISGGFTAFMRAFSGMTMGLSDVPSETWRAVQMAAGRSRQQSQVSASEQSNVSPSSRQSSQQNLIREESLTDARNPSNLSDRSTPTLASNAASSFQPGPSQRCSDASLDRSCSRNISESGEQPDIMRPTGVHVSKGAGRFVKAMVQGPVDMSANFAKGFHNMPRLWGDETVRPQEKVSDLKSGIKAVGREFGYGWYDGVTGLVTQPWRGAQKDGASGFVKGVGKGIGGFIAKSSAASFGILGHTLQGLSKEALKLFGNNVQSYIIASRVAQGYEEWLRSSDVEKQGIVASWKQLQKNLNKKGKARETLQQSEEVQQRNLEAREDLNNGGLSARSAGVDSSTDSRTQDLTNTTALAVGDSQPPPYTANMAPEMSWGAVGASTRGDASTDDADVELQRPRAHQTDEDMYGDGDREGERNEVLSSKELAVDGMSSRYQRPPLYDPGHVDGTTRSAIEAQQNDPQRDKTSQEKTEEDIVLEYTKKQSLLEVHHQNKGKDRAAAIEDEDDEDLQKALSLSRQDWHYEDDEDDEDLQKALEMSRQEHGNR